MGNEAPGLHLDSSGKIVSGNIIYNHSVSPRIIDNSIHGTLITEKVAQKIIQNHWDNLTEVIDDDEVIAVSFGKSDLQLILDQTGCEGIRFYFAKKLQIDFEDTHGIVDGKTLVAVGVTKDNYDIGTIEKRYIVKPLKPRPSDHNHYIKQSGVPEDGIIIEMVPPLTLGKVRNDPKGFLDDSLESIIKKFFNLQ